MTGARLAQAVRRPARTLAAGLLLLASAAQAQDGWGLPELMHELSAVQQAQARFVERRYLQILKQPLELTGTLTYAAPGRLEKHTLTPRPERMTVEADRLVVEDLGKGRKRTLALQDYPVLWAFIESFRATLQGDLAALSRFYTVELEGPRERWRLQLKPKDKRMSAVVSDIRISGSHASIARIEIDEARGDRSVMTVEEVQ
jgi:hypothetical protein